MRTEYLDRHPDVIERLLRGHIEATRFVNERADEARRVVNDGIERITGKRIADGVMTAAWANLTFTTDPIASSLARSAKAAEQAGLLDRVDLDGIYDLRLLNDARSGVGEQAVVGL